MQGANGMTKWALMVLMLLIMPVLSIPALAIEPGEELADPALLKRARGALITAPLFDLSKPIH